MVEIIGIDPPEHLTPIAVNESKNENKCTDAGSKLVKVLKTGSQVRTSAEPKSGL